MTMSVSGRRGLRFWAGPTGGDGRGGTTIGRSAEADDFGALGSAVSELAWDRAKLTKCFGGLGIRVAQMGFAAQATYWSAVDLHKAFMTTICEALGRPLQGAHPEEVTALAAKADLLTAGGCS